MMRVSQLESLPEMSNAHREKHFDGGHDAGICWDWDAEEGGVRPKEPDGDRCTRQKLHAPGSA